MATRKRRTIRDRNESISSRKKRNRGNPLQAELDKPLAKSFKEGAGVAAVIAGPGKVIKAGKIFKAGGKAALKAVKKAAVRKKTIEAANKVKIKLAKIKAEGLKTGLAAKARKANAKLAGKERVKKAHTGLRATTDRAARAKKAQQSPAFKKQEEFFSPANIAKRSAKAKQDRATKEAAKKLVGKRKRFSKKNPGN